MKDIVINGKIYPLWQQFVQKKNDWIGGELVDYGDKFDSFFASNKFPKTTKIRDITLTKGSLDTAILTFHGEDFDCGSDSKHLGIVLRKERRGLNFLGYAGHEWTISKP